MADYDLPSVLQSLRAADAAGNTEDATRLSQIVRGMSSASPVPSPSDNASIPEEAGKGFMSSLYGVSQGFADILDKMGATHGSPEAAKIREQAAQKYKQYITENAPAVPSVSDIKSAHDAALWASSKLGSMGPYIAGALAGGAPLAATMGAAQSGEQEAQNPDATPASITTGAALGGATGAARVPFLTGSGGVLSRVAKGALVGGPVVGAIQGATENIPRAVASGDIDQGLPTSAGVWDAILGNSLGMGTFAGAHAAGEKALNKLTQPATASQPEDGAKARLATRIGDVAEQNDFNLKKVAYDAGDGAKAALDTVHNGLAEDIKGVWDVVKGDLDQSTISNVNDLLDRTALNASIRSAKNKVKGRVGDDDLQTLQDAVGHTQEGQVLVDLVRQSNALTDLFSGGLKGGLSRYTDYLNPLGHGGPENGYTSVLRTVAPKAVEAGILLHNPALGIPMAAGFGLGRGVDALTGNRSTVARFVNDNIGSAAPVDFSGARYSILDQQARQAASIAGLARQKQALQQAQDQLNTQQDQANQARLLQREQELRTQNRLDNNPGLGGFDRYVYDQTGIRPGDASAGVFQLYHQGKITPSEFHGWHMKPDTLKVGNAGNHIIDMLDRMARDGQLQRDPNWTQSAPAAAASPQTNIANPAAYAAQAAGNQARLVSAMDRVASSEHSPASKQTINDAISAVGRTNNRADAEAVRQNAVQALAIHSPEAAQYANQELSPLVKQIRHETSEAAIKAARQGHPREGFAAVAANMKGPTLDSAAQTIAERLISDPSSATIQEIFGPNDGPLFEALVNQYGLSKALDKWREIVTSSENTGRESQANPLSNGEGATAQSGLAKLVNAARSFNGAASPTDTGRPFSAAE